MKTEKSKNTNTTHTLNKLPKIVYTEKAKLFAKKLGEGVVNGLRKI